ncbi:LysM peptidoglycan-binding domain-containing protein, partial [Pseudomonas viridiflava]|uniref:LysM peptidoglycan-binding domain-containing protein n=1 Tax=Pseudomonas viridiflava TaxID=33069 RepID=UPI0019D0E30C
FTPNDVPVIPETAFAVDNGAVPGATGEPATNGAGEIITYTVVAGDSFFDIAQRFGERPFVQTADVIEQRLANHQAGR